jgi:TIR domain/Pentapeptide repeats (8 copies)
MANEEHLKILRQGVKVWNEWMHNEWIAELETIKKESFKELIVYGNSFGADLSGADLTKANLAEINFEYVDLRDSALRSANLSDAHLQGAKLEGSDLRDANLCRANLTRANLVNSNLKKAMLIGADASWANLSGANLSRAFLNRTGLNEAKLDGANLAGAGIGGTIFGSNNLSNVIGLDSVLHTSPSVIGIDTLYKSGGKIPESFLHGCGVPDELIAYLPSMIGARQAIQFYSCFISYSSKDEGFCRRLHSRMRDEHLRVWFAPEDVKGGEKLYEQIDRAIQMHDRLLIVLSEESLKSKWVMTEIRRARKTELREERRKLFPIRLCSYERLCDWECLDADTGEDLAVEVRGYFIPDFSNWKDHDAFESAFDKLLKDLRAAEGCGNVDW